MFLAHEASLEDTQYIFIPGELVEMHRTFLFSRLHVAGMRHSTSNTLFGFEHILTEMRLATVLC